MKLTAKQERFAQLIADGKHNQSDAYRDAYDAEYMSDEAIWVAASQLVEHHKVKIRIAELIEEARKRNEVTLDEIINGIREAAGIARDKDDANNLRGAYMDLAKVTGQVVEKKQITGDVQLNTSQESVVERFLNRATNKK